MRISIVFIGLASLVQGITLDWIPADPEGPLPLSASFREKLGRLCDLIASGNALPPDIEGRLPDLKKMCAKLYQAERAPRGVVKKSLAAVSAIAAGAWAYHSWETKGIVWKLYQDHKRAKARAARAARRRAQIYGFAHPKVRPIAKGGFSVKDR